MKKPNLLILIVATLAIIGAGAAYVLLHKSPSHQVSGNSNTSQSTNNTVAAVNNAVLHTATNTGLGQYLTDPSGNALYTYGGDTSGVSNCTGSCLAVWPAYQDKGSTSNLPTDVGTIVRSDNGQTQYTYKGMPLYYFASDTTGSATGDGINNFHVARPAGGNTSTPSSSSSSSNSNSSYPY